MSEEKSQEEKVRQNQVEMARSMKVKPGLLEILEQTEDWIVREWIYICALEGMNEKQLKELQTASVRKIQKNRREFLQEKFSSADGTLQKEVEQLQLEVQQVAKDSRDVRRAIEEGLKDALEKQAAAQEEALRATKSLLNVKEQEVQDLKKKNESLICKIRQIEQESVCPKETNEEKMETQTIEREESTGGYGKKEKQEFSLPGFLFRRKKESEIRKFIETYLQGTSFNEEQKEYLLQCLEEGMSVKAVEKFAIPGIDVSMMQRLKQLQQKEEKQSERTGTGKASN